MGVTTAFKHAFDELRSLFEHRTDPKLCRPQLPWYSRLKSLAQKTIVVFWLTTWIFLIGQGKLGR